MGGITYKPSPEVLAGVGVFAKEAGFRKAGTRFRLATSAGHGLVLWGEEQATFKPGRSRGSNWYLTVCYRPWADLYNAHLGRPPVADGLKVDPTRHGAVTFSPKGRPTTHPMETGYEYDPTDAADVDAWVDHVGRWFSDVALPMSLEWLEDPRLILDQLFVRRAHYNRHVQTDIWPAHMEAPLAVVIAKEIGDAAYANEVLGQIEAAAEAGNDLMKSWLQPLRDFTLHRLTPRT